MPGEAGVAEDRKRRLMRRKTELDEAGVEAATKDRPGRQTYTEERKQQAATLIQAHARGRVARRHLARNIAISELGR